MSNPRERRLIHEFDRMLAIRRPNGLIDFHCADLSAAEASEYLKPSMSFEVVRNSLPGFRSPEEFQQRFPGRAPEKYLVMFRCIGLMKDPASGEVRQTHQHLLEVVFGLDYPAKPPRFVWLTPIWHPNIKTPYLCPHGRPFAVGTTLDQLCLLVGQMIQYRNYNVLDPLDREAALWAREHRDMFPIDTRGLLDGEAHARPLVSLSAGGDLVTFGGEERAAAQSGTPCPLIDLL